MLQVIAVELTGQCARRIGLVGVALTLMPKHSAKSMRAELLQARTEIGEDGSFALPIAGRKLSDMPGQRWRIGKSCSFREPFAHARCSDTARDDSYRHVEFFRDGIAKRGHEAAALSAGPGLWIVGKTPSFSVKRRD